MERHIKIAVSTALQDAGEATRSLEIAKGIRERAPKGYTPEICFFSHGSKFEKNVTESGFEIEGVSPVLDGVGFINDLKPSKGNFVGSESLAVEMLKGEIETLEKVRPDIILHGFWPFAGIARRMVSPVIPSICFLPIPLTPSLYNSYLMKDVPDQLVPLTYLPEKLRRRLIKAAPPSLSSKAPILKQTNLLNAAKLCGWEDNTLNNLFDMLRSDFTVINDLPEFYDGVPMPLGFILTGPLYAPPEQGDVDPEILKVFEKTEDGQVNIFCSMGSSGRKEMLIEAVKAIADLPDRFHALILAPKAVCDIKTIESLVSGKDNINITDRFVPAKTVNAMADIAVIHGGQGTVQTALVSGTPVVGVAMQPEQQINLDHIVLSGAGIRIPAPRWNKKNITKSVKKIAYDDSYKKSAKRIGGLMEAVDGKIQTADAVWNFLVSRIQRGLHARK